MWISCGKVDKYENKNVDNVKNFVEKFFINILDFCIIIWYNVCRKFKKGANQLCKLLILTDLRKVSTEELSL